MNGNAERDDSMRATGIWLTISLIALSSIVLVSQYAPYIPDYDGLAYFDTAKTVNGWFFGATDYKLWGRLANDYVVLWPITNAPSVFFAAIFMHVVDINILPALINTLYLALFSAYLIKIRSASYAIAAIVFLCADTLFFRLFTTLTSEFSVGLWIFAFLATLVTIHPRRGAYLSVLTLLGLLLRTIDIVFIMSAVMAYVIVHYAFWRDGRHVYATVRSVGLSVLLTAPLFFDHYRVALEYVYSVSFGATADSWKSLGGVTSRLDVVSRYAQFLLLYNPLILPATLLAVIAGLYSKSIESRWVALLLAMAASVCLPLMLASSLNIQVVYWVFAPLVFVCCEIGYRLTDGVSMKVRNSTWIKKTLTVVLILYGIFLLRVSWAYEVRYLNQQKELSDIAQKISSVLVMSRGKNIIASNYWGVGALDATGLAFFKRDKFGYGGISDIYSRKKNAGEYLDFTDDLNIFITAHENYFFPPHFGINEHVAEIHDLMVAKSGDYGFRKVSTISHGGMQFDIWYRPVVQPHLQYESFNDYWISSSLPVDVGSKELCAGEKVYGKLHLKVQFPNPNKADYTPPFAVSLVNENANSVIASATVNTYGNADVEFDVKNIPCGEYFLSFDKKFSTHADPRKLSAMFIKLDTILKFKPK